MAPVLGCGVALTHFQFWGSVLKPFQKAPKSAGKRHPIGMENGRWAHVDGRRALVGGTHASTVSMTGTSTADRWHRAVSCPLCPLCPLWRRASASVARSRLCCVRTACPGSACGKDEMTARMATWFKPRLQFRGWRRRPRCVYGGFRSRESTSLRGLRRSAVEPSEVTLKVSARNTLYEPRPNGCHLCHLCPLCRPCQITSS